MSIRDTNFVSNEYYHVYSRGNSKQKIFRDKRDYERFVSLLYGTNTKARFNFFNAQKNGGVFLKKFDNKLVSIGAYCLMPNHFHILIKPQSEEGLSKFMQKILTSYSMYFNEKYKRTGGLFEGKFKSIHVNNDRQLKYLFSYIHLNPIKLINKKWKEEGIKNTKETFDYLDKYTYSSYLDYAGENRKEKVILKLDDFPNYFPSKISFKREIVDWLKYVKNT